MHVKLSLTVIDCEISNPSSHRQSREYVLILLYCCVTLPSGYAVRLTATSQATGKVDVTCEVLFTSDSMTSTPLCGCFICGVSQTGHIL